MPLIAAIMYRARISRHYCISPYRACASMCITATIITTRTRRDTALSPHIDIRARMVVVVARRHARNRRIARSTQADRRVAAARDTANTVCGNALSRALSHRTRYAQVRAGVCAPVASCSTAQRRRSEISLPFNLRRRRALQPFRPRAIVRARPDRALRIDRR